MNSPGKENRKRSHSNGARILFLLAALSIFLATHAMHEIDSEGALMAQDKGGTSVKKSWMSGKYFVSRKQMVPGATVKVINEENNRVYLTSTDEEGTWRLNNIPEGSYRVEIVKEGFSYIEKDDVGVRFPFRTVVELQAIPSMETIGNIRRWGGASKEKNVQEQEETASGTYSLSGKASAINGDSLLDAEIRLRNFNREVNPRRTFSDSNGSFALEGLPGGIYDLSIVVPGYLPLRIIMDVHADSELMALLLLQPLNYEATPSELLPSEKPIPPR